MDKDDTTDEESIDQYESSDTKTLADDDTVEDTDEAVEDVPYDKVSDNDISDDESVLALLKWTMKILLR